MPALCQSNALTLTLLAVFLSLGCDGQSRASVETAREPTDTAAALAAVESVGARFIDAYNRDDAAAIAALHTDSVRFISEGTIEVGRAKLQEGWRKSLPDLSDLKFTTLDRVVSGDLATEIFRWTQHYRQGETSVVDSGYGVSVLRRGTDGQWRWDTHALSRVPVKP